MVSIDYDYLNFTFRAPCDFIKRHPVAQITPYLLLAPLLASILGVIFLHDQVGIRVWIGGALVLSGVLAIALRNLQKAKPESPAIVDLI